MSQKKAVPTKTVNPLHLEDLEPRRFEDLVRQLAYDFRKWERLEPFGRSGDDGGIDILGIESASDTPHDSDRDEDEAEDENEDPGRVWRIQCKRYKRLSPSELRKIVREVVPDPGAPPYGVIVAAACDVSAKGFVAFHDEAAKRGVKACVLWTRTTIEDQLYLPKNDHLLFAYCGLSLQVRQRSRLTEVRRRIVLKRKILRVFGIPPEEFSSEINQDVLVRDIADETFPYGADGRIRLPGLEDDAPSQDCRMEAFHPKGIIVGRFTYVGWHKADGAWDGIRESKKAVGSLSSLLRRRLEGAKPWEPPSWSKYGDHVPEEESFMLHESQLIPWENILEVDPFGENGITGVHLLCRFEGKRGPYRGGLWLKSVKWTSASFRSIRTVDHEMKRELYKELDAKLAAQTAPNVSNAEPNEPVA